MYFNYNRRLIELFIRCYQIFERTVMTFIVCVCVLIIKYFIELVSFDQRIASFIN